MGHEELKQIGVSAYGHRHRILKGIERLQSRTPGQLTAQQQAHLQIQIQSTVLTDLTPDEQEYLAVEEEMQSTIREHRDNGQAGGIFVKYRISTIQKIRNKRLWEKYTHRRREVAEENSGSANERLLFHGSKEPSDMNELGIRGTSAITFPYLCNASHGQITYMVSLPALPDLPAWASLAYIPESNGAFLYGVPPTSPEKVLFEIVALNRVTYETSQLTWDLETYNKTSPPRRKIRLMIHNLNVADFFTGDRKTKLLEIFTKELWPESFYDLRMVDLASSVAMGSRKPSKPSEKEGALVILGSQMEFSDTLVDLQREVSPLWNSQPCPRDFKKTSVERNFRQKGFIVDWCSFKLVSSEVEEKLFSGNVLDPAFVSPSVDFVPSLVVSNGGVWRSPMKAEIPQRNFVHDGVFIVLGVIVLGVLLMLGVAAALAVHPDGGQSLGTLDASADIPLRTYIASSDVASMACGTGTLLSNMGWGSYSKESSPFLLNTPSPTPKSTIPRLSKFNDDQMSSSRPSPPPYFGSLRK
nr:EOG090X04W0 [Lepidurus arcticus]